MQRTTRLLTLASLVVLVGAALAQDKVPTIKEIMTRVNKPGGLYPTISKELKADDTDWDEARAQSKAIAKMAAALGKNTAPMGDPLSWAKLTKEYADNARALDDAVAKRDKAAANAARARLGGEACKSCHKAHMKK
jgi:cytochrome c556